MRKSIVLCGLICLFLTISSFAEIITIADTQDASNWGDYFLPDDVEPHTGTPPKYLPYYRWDDNDWGWTQTLNFEGPVSEVLFIVLEIEAWDVNPPSSEVHRLFGDGIYLGDLQPPPGVEDIVLPTFEDIGWSTTRIVLRPEALEALMDGEMDMWIDIDADTLEAPGEGCRAVTLGNSTLTVTYTDVPLEEPYTPPEEPYIPPYDYYIPDYEPPDEPQDEPNDPEDPQDEPDEPFIPTIGSGETLYTLYPVDISLPTINDPGDGIAQIGGEQAWFAFDISLLPDDEYVVGAYFVAELLDFGGITSQRTLWYASDDSWIVTYVPNTSDPKNSPADYIVGTVLHNEQAYTWTTIEITHDWQNDLIDDYITLMLTGPESGRYEGGAVNLLTAQMHVVTSLEPYEPPDDPQDDPDEPEDPQDDPDEPEDPQDDPDEPEDPYDPPEDPYTPPDELFIPTVYPGETLYTFYPADRSSPTICDPGDGIAQIGGEQAWFAFDISSIPDDEQVVTAYFVAEMVDFGGVTSQRTLWYASDDSWIVTYVPNSSDPKNSPADYIVGTVLHNERDYTWTSIEITHDWLNDLIDNYITLMLTGPESGRYEGGAVNILTAQMYVITTSDSGGMLFDLGPEELVQADGLDIDVGTYSVPTLADWNSDNLQDLIIGTRSGKVIVYLNTGTESEPNFKSKNSFYIQADGEDIFCPPVGCMGCFPRIVDWNNDGCKDLLVGHSDGRIRLFINTNTDPNQEPTFDNGEFLQYGKIGFKIDIDVGSRATPTIADWNSDGKKDLVVGSIDGKIHIFINENTDAEPDLIYRYFALEDYSVLEVPSLRSSPEILDLDSDGRKDILTGNTNGQLLFYSNVGTDEQPLFSGYVPVDSNGVEIDLPDNPRSRPSVCFWGTDGYPDVLIGAEDGKVHLFQCIPLPGDTDTDGDIDFTDFATIAQYWQQTDCGKKCEIADINHDGKIDMDDLSWLTAYWLIDMN